MRTNWTSRLGRASAVLALAGLAVFSAGASAEARDYRGWNHYHHWNNGWHGNNHWRGGWNGWQSSNGYGYTWPQRYWRAPVYSAPAYYPPAYYPPRAYYPSQAYSYYPEPVAPSLNFTIPLR